ncbi:DUF421 domain-containing protein [Neptunicoccus cionae]|uniref:DUF421 domain-containing protein n=1 Tax=Neptunicoccus cionae TaxID=2035344 RepID=A0A916QNV6_9RHOB|nr:YetF domain-containing protein [Amylibacter cionae]GGA04736.1 hypothetical protein GCM10011498_00010 [Amylibacter cionae]
MFFDGPYLDALAKGNILGILGLFWIILMVRVVGLRSFSKMTNFDFVTTVAMGSLLAGASQSKDSVGFLQSMAAMASLFIIQYAVSKLRHNLPWFDQAVQNTPVFLMKDGIILYNALERTRVTENDLIAKLREAGATDIQSVSAAVLETTGDISVLLGNDTDVLKGVKLI